MFHVAPRLVSFAAAVTGSLIALGGAAPAFADHGSEFGVINDVAVQCADIDEFFPGHGPSEQLAATIELDPFDEEPADEVIINLGSVRFGVVYSFDDQLWVPTDVAVAWDDLNTMITAVIIGGDESSLVHFGWPEGTLTGPDGEVRELSVCAHQAVTVTGGGLCLDEGAVIAYETAASGFEPADDQVFINFSGVPGSFQPLSGTILWPEGTYDEPGSVTAEFSVIDPAGGREYIAEVEIEDPGCTPTDGPGVEDDDSADDDANSGGGSEDSTESAKAADDDITTAATLPETGAFDNVALIAAVGLLTLLTGTALAVRARRARR